MPRVKMYDDKYPVYGVSTSGYFSNPWRTEPEEEEKWHILMLVQL